MDRCLQLVECEMCFHKFRVMSLVRLQITQADDLSDVDNRVLCERCKDYVVDYWWWVNPTLHRYYHPA